MTIVHAILLSLGVFGFLCLIYAWVVCMRENRCICACHNPIDPSRKPPVHDSVEPCACEYEDTPY